MTDRAVSASRPCIAKFAQTARILHGYRRARLHLYFKRQHHAPQDQAKRHPWGINVLLYISIDSATSAGFARFRDDSFDQIIADLRTLCLEKKQHQNLPHVTVSFIVMNSNKSELRDFIALMHAIGVDRVKLMSLHREDSMELDGRVQQRGEFVFDYEREIVSLAELDTLGQDAQLAADEIGLELAPRLEGLSIRAPRFHRERAFMQ